MSAADNATSIGANYVQLIYADHYVNVHACILWLVAVFSESHNALSHVATCLDQLIYGLA